MVGLLLLTCTRAFCVFHYCRALTIFFFSPLYNVLTLISQMNMKLGIINVYQEHINHFTKYDNQKIIPENRMVYSLKRR